MYIQVPSLYKCVCNMRRPFEPFGRLSPSPEVCTGRDLLLLRDGHRVAAHIQNSVAPPLRDIQILPRRLRNMQNTRGTCGTRGTRRTRRTRGTCRRDNDAFNVEVSLYIVSMQRDKCGVQCGGDSTCASRVNAQIQSRKFRGWTFQATV